MFCCSGYSTSLLFGLLSLLNYHCTELCERCMILNFTEFSLLKQKNLQQLSFYADLKNKIRVTWHIWVISSSLTAHLILCRGIIMNLQHQILLSVIMALKILTVLSSHRKPLNLFCLHVQEFEVRST